jgi:dCTP diphosphatase
MDLERAQQRLAESARERDWEQFHNPKNLVMALAGEVGELAAIFQWLTPDQAAAVMTDPASAARVRTEVADVSAYLLRLADVLEIDILSALAEKITLNETRYPIDLSRGRADKYDELGVGPRDGEQTRHTC